LTFAELAIGGVGQLCPDRDVAKFPAVLLAALLFPGADACDQLAVAVCPPSGSKAYAYTHRSSSYRGHHSLPAKAAQEVCAGAAQSRQDGFTKLGAVYRERLLQRGLKPHHELRLMVEDDAQRVAIMATGVTSRLAHCLSSIGDPDIGHQGWTGKYVR
jgi:hypothetical protein